MKKKPNRREYEKQLQIYQKGTEEIFESKGVESKIFWTKKLRKTILPPSSVLTQLFRRVSCCIVLPNQLLRLEVL